jgi:hypothetical protein
MAEKPKKLRLSKEILRGLKVRTGVKPGEAPTTNPLTGSKYGGCENTT